MVLVFKTNVRNRRQSGDLRQLLLRLDAVERCSFDLQDRDRVLRVQGKLSLSARNIEQLLWESGYVCAELPD